MDSVDYNFNKYLEFIRNIKYIPNDIYPKEDTIDIRYDNYTDYQCKHCDYTNYTNCYTE